jgi:DUF4097 and DUF4098 domain-containing protein YvlB
MSERVVKVDVDGPPAIDVSVSAGNVIVRPGNDDEVKVILTGAAEVVDEASVDVTPDSVTVRSSSQKPSRRFFSKSMDVAISVPAGVRVRVAIASGDVRIRVDAEDVEVNSSRGDIRIDKVAKDVRIKAASGDVTVSRCGREFSVSSASGDIRVDHAVDAVIKSASGDVVMGRVDGLARIRTASGDVKVRNYQGIDLDISTMSGDVFVGLAAGRTVGASIKTLSGDFRNKIKPANGERTGAMALSISSFSGDVTLTSVK